MGRNALRVTLLGLLAFALASAPSAHASELVTLDVPSVGNVDVRTAVFGAIDERPRVVRLNVLLPDGYDASKAYPLLYLLHGAGHNYAAWGKPELGDVRTTLKGLDAIIVMPEGGLGYYTNWWNGGRRGAPGWESYHLHEVLPFIERRFKIRPGRRWHAIAGFSMAGYGSSYLATQLPGYFGTVVPMSGIVSIQGAEVEQGLKTISGVPYEQVWGPRTAPYAEGHNPLALVENLRHTRVILRTGNGVPRPGTPFVDDSGAASAPLEAYLKVLNDEFAAALRRAGASVDYRVHEGVHDWPYWKEDIAEAMRIGFFSDRIEEAPARWSYRTVAQSGSMWGLSFQFGRPPETVALFSKDGERLKGTGSGQVYLEDGKGCVLRAALPFDRPLPGTACTDERLRVTAAGPLSRLRVLVTTRVAGRRVPVAGVLVRAPGAGARTARNGRATLAVKPPRGLRTVTVSVSRSGLRGDSLRRSVPRS